MSTEIREIQIEDYDDLIAFWQTLDGILLNDADSRENIERYLKRNPGMSFVAHDGEQVVASAMAGHDGRRGYIFHVGVAPGYRRYGLARTILGMCYDRLREAGIAKCYIFLLKDNDSGEEYWNSQGWSACNEYNVMSKWIKEVSPMLP